MMQYLQLTMTFGGEHLIACLFFWVSVFYTLFWRLTILDSGGHFGGNMHLGFEPETYG